MAIKTGSTESSRVGDSSPIYIRSVRDQISDNVWVVCRCCAPERGHAFHRIAIERYRSNLVEENTISRLKEEEGMYVRTRGERFV